jgi:hypothetical protein
LPVSVVLFDLSKPLLLHLFADQFLLLFLDFQLLLLEFSLFLLLQFDLPLFIHIRLIPGIPLLQIIDKILDGFQIVFLLFEPFLLVLLLHLPPDIPIRRLLSIPLLLPDKRLIGGKIRPILIELHDPINARLGIAEALKLPVLALLLDQITPGLPLLGLDPLKDLPVDRVEAALFIIIPLKARMAEVHPDVEPECVHFDVLLAHLLLIEQDFLAVGVVPGPLVRVRQRLVRLLHQKEERFRLLVPGVFVGVVFQGQFSVALCYLGTVRI